MLDVEEGRMEDECEVRMGYWCTSRVGNEEEISIEDLQNGKDGRWMGGKDGSRTGG